MLPPTRWRDEMAVPRPTLNNPPLPLVARALAAMGLPGPASVEVLAPPWSHANYRVAFPEADHRPDLLLRRVVHAPLGPTLQTEVAALTLLHLHEELPVVRDYRIVPPGLLPWPAAISSLLPGIQGMRFLREEGGRRGPELCRRLGGLMARLAAIEQPSFGTVPAGGRFVARRGSWRAEWAARVGALLAQARAGGTDLGPLTERVHARLEERLPALDTVCRWALVHGDLHPSNMLLLPDSSGSLRVSGLVDWEGAFLGDPLAEWSTLLELPVDTIGHVLVGYGLEEARALLASPEAVARLEVYAATRALARLAWCSGPLFRGDGGVRLAYGLEHARMVSAMVVEEDAVRRRLDSALRRAGQGRVVAQVAASATHRPLWRALGATHRGLIEGTQGAAAFGATIAAGLLATQAPRSAPWLPFAQAAADLLGPQAERGWSEPVGDRGAWRSGLQAAVLAGPQRSAFPLLCWWMALEALNRLGDQGSWPVNDELLRGVEGMVRLRLADEGRASVGAGRGALVHALLAMGALRRLAAMGLEVPESLSQRWRAQLSDGWDDIVLFGAGARRPPPGRPPILQWWPAGRAAVGGNLLVPPLILAVGVLRELPAPGEVVLATLGLDEGIVQVPR